MATEEPVAAVDVNTEPEASKPAEEVPATKTGKSKKAKEPKAKKPAQPRKRRPSSHPPYEEVRPMDYALSYHFQIRIRCILGDRFV